ncbi:MAG: YebC/PmpR family DNA-binding transcriptional regulator [Erysipelothrix sp.]|nr:YebC/PmpR family DNA-binding transcriptional regulator [Erysipelothrix sp.]
MGRAFEVRKAAMAKTADAKVKIYSRYGKEIYIAAKSGEPNPTMNLELARVIEKAKADQVPNDIINRAIEKAKGGLDEHYDALRYEGFGPGVSTLIVDTLTNNTNRTFSEVRNCFTKTGSKVGVNGSVSHAYDQVGILTFKDQNEDAVLEVLLMGDVDVIEVESHAEEISVIVNPKDLYLAKETLEKDLAVDDFLTLEITMLAHDYHKLNDDDKQNFEKLLSMLDECEDVQNVYHNIILE